MISKLLNMGKWKLVTIFLLLQMIIFVLPGEAEVTWDDVSRSLNDSFSGNQVFSFKNILGFVLILLIIMLVVFIFRQSWLKEEKESKRRRAGFSLRPLEQQQKRYWFRLKTAAEFEWTTACEALKPTKNKYKTDRLVDISGGGLSFTTAEKLNAGDGIKLFLDTGGDKPLPISGRVLRIEENIVQDSIMYRVSVQYENILLGERDKIISFIMKKQREEIKEKQEEKLEEKSQEKTEDIIEAPEAGE